MLHTVIAVAVGAVIGFVLGYAVRRNNPTDPQLGAR